MGCWHSAGYRRTERGRGRWEGERGRVWWLHRATSLLHWRSQLLGKSHLCMMYFLPQCLYLLTNGGFTSLSLSLSLHHVGGVLTSCSTFWSNMGVYWNIGPSQLTSMALIDETAVFGEPLVPGLICGPASWFNSNDSPCSMKLTKPVWENTWTMRSHVWGKVVLWQTVQPCYTLWQSYRAT